MPITRLNHAVLYVSHLARSVAFYTQVLGFEPVAGMSGLPGAAFLRASGSSNDHDLGLFEIGSAADAAGAGPRRRAVGLYHLAWEVETLDDLETIAGALSSTDALVGASDHGTTKSLYGHDPDGIEFEVVWIVPAALLDDTAIAARSRIGPLDLRREMERYGSTTRGGVGISQPA